MSIIASMSLSSRMSAQVASSIVHISLRMSP